MRVYGEQHRNLWWCLWIHLIAGRKIQIVGFKMRVYGVKVENFVETFSFLERQPPNPVIRGHKKSAVRKRRESSEAGRIFGIGEAMNCPTRIFGIGESGNELPYYEQEDRESEFPPTEESGLQTPPTRDNHILPSTPSYFYC